MNNIQQIQDCVSSLQALSFFMGFLIMLLVILITFYLLKKEKIKKMEQFKKETGVDMDALKTMLTGGNNNNLQDVNSSTIDNI